MCLQPTAQCNHTALSCTLHAPLTAGGSCRPAARLQLTPRASLRQHPVNPAPHPRGACPVGVPWPSMTATTLSFLRCSTPGPKGRGRTRTSGRPERPALPAPRARSWPGRPRSAAGSAAWTGPAGGQRGPGGTAPHPVGGAGNSHTWPLIPFPPHLVNVAPGGRRVWCLRHEDLAGAWPACPPRAHPADRRVGRTDQSRQVCQVCQRQLLTSKCLALRHRHSEDPEPPATLSSPWSRCGPVSRRLPSSENPPSV